MSFRHVLDGILTEEQIDKFNSLIGESQFDEKNQAHRTALDVRHILDDFNEAMLEAYNSGDLRKLQYLKSVLYKARDSYSDYGKEPSDVMRKVGPVSDY